eukprot:scaffold1857_cov96-Skeletonema_dohrnii-CCMP3373.AAC.2
MLLKSGDFDTEIDAKLLELLILISHREDASRQLKTRSYSSHLRIKRECGTMHPKDLLCCV